MAQLMQIKIINTKSKIFDFLILATIQLFLIKI